MYQNFKHLRKTKHTHNPVDDAMGNVEALIQMADKFDLKGIVWITILNYIYLLLIGLFIFKRKDGEDCLLKLLPQ